MHDDIFILIFMLHGEMYTKKSDVLIIKMGAF